MDGQRPKIRREAGGFALPIKHERRWANDEAFPTDAPQESERLDGFAQPHLIRDDARKSILLQRGEPIHPLLLIGPQDGLETAERDLRQILDFLASLGPCAPAGVALDLGPLLCR